jgi:hypothetical protein
VLSQTFRSAYVGANQSSEGELDQSPESAFPMIQLMKAALCFDNIKGFGEWSILLSTRAQQDLRDVRRVEYEIFRMVMKKIK